MRVNCVKSETTHTNIYRQSVHPIVKCSLPIIPMGTTLLDTRLSFYIPSVLPLLDDCLDVIPETSLRSQLDVTPLSDSPTLVLPLRPPPPTPLLSPPLTTCTTNDLFLEGPCIFRIRLSYR